MNNGVRHFSRPLSVLLILALLIALTPPVYAVPQVNVKLNHALEANKPVLDFRVSPDGSRIAYRVARVLPPDQDAPPPPAADLYSVPATGGTAVKLNPDAAVDSESVESYQFSADGSEIIYLRTTTDATLGNVFELFRVPADGSSATVSISGPVAVGNRATRDFEFSFEEADIQVVLGDGSVRSVNFNVRHRSVPERISSITDGSSNTFFFGEETNNLIQTPIGEAPRQINPDLVRGGVVYDFAITPDGTRAIYRADQNLDGAIELFSVPADGSDVGFRISGPLVAGGDVLDFKVNATSSRAVYLADQTTNGVIELYSARTNGGVVAKLNAPLVSGGNVTQFQFTPDGNLVVYLADQNQDGRFQLFGVATTGSLPFLLSSQAAVGSVRSFLMSPSGDRLFYVDNTGPGGTLRLYIQTVGFALTSTAAASGPPVANITTPDVKVSNDGEHVVYLADNGNDGVYELASITLSPVPTAVSQINAPLVAGGNIRGFKISPDGQRVVYVADQNTPGVFELFSVPIGGGVVERVSGPLVDGGSVLSGAFDFQFSPDGSAIYYLADAETDNLTELFAAFDAPTIQFATPFFVVAENDPQAPQFVVQRSGNVQVSSSVLIGMIGAPDGGTAQGGASLAVAGVDFVDNLRTVDFAAGEITKTFSVAIKNDGVAEPAETFQMQAFEPEQAVLGPSQFAQVTILDNADAPLLNDISVPLSENTTNNTLVLNATPGAQVGISAVTTYTILSGNTNNAFRIVANGDLFVNNSAALNYETTPVFTLVIEARTDGGSYDQATWTINLQNVNEPPIFTAQTRSVAENTINGSLVGAKLVATDPEGTVLIFTTASSIFNLSTSGQLSVKDGSKLDFETQKTHTLNVTAADTNGNSTVAVITVNVTDIAEGDATAPSIAKYSPASAVAGGKEFTLVIGGNNLTSSSVVRWNGSNRKTTLLKGLLYATIPAQDITNVTTAKIDVVDTVTKKASSTIAFPVTKGNVGIAELTTTPSTQGSAVGLVSVFNLEWTHTTEPWRTMDEMDLRLTDGEKIALWVRYQETRDENGAEASTVFLLNADGTPAGSGRFGDDVVLENETVRIDLRHANFIGSGETGSNILVTLPVIFKDAAVQAEAYTIEMYGVDDLGGEQGPNVMGTWTISTPTTFLPQMAKP